MLQRYLNQRRAALIWLSLLSPGKHATLCHEGHACDCAVHLAFAPAHTAVMLCHMFVGDRQCLASGELHVGAQISCQCHLTGEY